MPAHRVPLMERFEAKVTVDEVSGCWLWTGATRNGYGTLQADYPDRRMLSAHRLSWEFHYGKIPTGLEIDHLCFTKTCVRPDHLEAVGRSVNRRRASRHYEIREAKTHCPHGHAYTEENTFRRRGRRECRTCIRDRARAQRQRRRPCNRNREKVRR